MAKCFQLVGQGIPVRMSDEDAFQIVDRDKDGQYCPKSVWKRERARRDDPGTYRLDGSKIKPALSLHDGEQ